MNSPEEVSRIMAERGVADSPPEGFAVFKARFGRYLIHGLAHQDQVASIISSLDPDELVAFVH